MRPRLKVSLDPRSMRACLLCAIALGIFAATAFALEHEDAGNAHKASPTSTTTPAALKPIVLITGGTGYVDLPTGKSPGVLNSADISDPPLHPFLPPPAVPHRP